MPLNLQDRFPAQTVFNAGVSVDDLAWWFWIKAGMGFTIGATLVALICGVISWIIIVAAGLLMLMGHR
jgi:hypothetical protein